MTLGDKNEEHSEIYLQYFEAASAMMLRVDGEYGRLSLAFEDLFGFYWKTMAWFDGKPWGAYPQFRKVILLFYVRGLSAAFSAADLAFKSAYTECYAVLRTTYESLVRVILIAERPGELSHGMSPGLNMQAADREAGLNLYRSVYRLLSAHSHSHIVDVVGDLERLYRRRAEGIALGREFDEARFTGTLNMTMYFMWGFLFLAPSVFPQLRGDDVWMREHEQMIGTVGRTFAEHPKPFWRRAYSSIVPIPARIVAAGES